MCVCVCVCLSLSLSLSLFVSLPLSICLSVSFSFLLSFFLGFSLSILYDMFAQTWSTQVSLARPVMCQHVKNQAVCKVLFWAHLHGVSCKPQVSLKCYASKQAAILTLVYMYDCARGIVQRLKMLYCCATLFLLLYEVKHGEMLWGFSQFADLFMLLCLPVTLRPWWTGSRVRSALTVLCCQITMI